MNSGMQQRRKAIGFLTLEVFNALVVAEFTPATGWEFESDEVPAVSEYNGARSPHKAMRFFYAEAFNARVRPHETRQTRRS